MYKYLPIGSVVLMKDSKKRVMICGIKQHQADSEKKIWDYSGCLYPEGVQRLQNLYLFDNDQIEMLYFIGFQDGESLLFLKNISDTDSL